MKRLFWLGAGVGIGVVVVRMLTRNARKFTPAGLAGAAQESIGGAAAAVRNLVDDIRDGMHEREDEIRSAFAEGTALDAPDLPWAHDVGRRFLEFQRREAEHREGE